MLGSDAVLLAEYAGTSGVNNWTIVPFNNGANIIDFRFVIMQIWRRDNVIFPSTSILPKNVFLTHNYETPILLHVPVMNGVTTGEVIGYVGCESVTSCAMYISHVNYKLKLFGVK